MDKHNQTLEELIRKYEHGETSREEEQELFQYFTAQDIDPRHAGIQAQFLYFQNQKQAPVGIPITFTSLAVKSPVERTLLRSLYLPVAAMVMVALGIGWWAFWYNGTHTVTTGPQERISVLLSDGTQVHLNSDSELEYPRQFNGNQRAIHLTGEAYFDVQRDVSRPFIIQAGSITAEVLGTSFNLRSYLDEEFDALDVREGRVRFGATDKIVVGQGRGARFYRQQQLLEESPAHVNSDAWQSRKLTFKNALLKDVFRDLERTYHVTIQAKPPGILQCYFTAEFIDTPLDEIVEVLAATFELQYKKIGNTYTLTGTPCHRLDL